VKRVCPHSFLTAISPIEHRGDDPEGRLSGIREVLRTTTQAMSPFRQCPGAHMVRLQVIDSLRPAMGDMDSPPLKSSYLLFVAELDGSVDDFLDALYGADPAFVRNIWGRCGGYPPYEGAVFYRRYIKRCMIEDPMPFAAFDADVDAILQALARKEALADWLTQTLEHDDAALQKSWQAQREALVNARPAPRGTL
jgi:hypothetical protein